MTTLAFASCMKTKDQSEHPVWRTIQDAHPDFLFLQGRGLCVLRELSNWSVTGTWVTEVSGHMGDSRG